MKMNPEQSAKQRVAEGEKKKMRRKKKERREAGERNSEEERKRKYFLNERGERNQLKKISIAPLLKLTFCVCGAKF